MTADAARSVAARAVPVAGITLARSVDAYITGRPTDARPTPLGAPGNLAHRRPHLPERLAADRRAAVRQMDLQVEDLHLMQQVHGAEVAEVTAATPRGAELRGVDGAVTSVAARALAVQVADCVPVLIAADGGPIAVAHAGRRGVVAGIVPRVIERLRAGGAGPLRALVGPAIGGCCYEVPPELQAEVAAAHPRALATTSWDTPALDLPAAVRAQLAAADVEEVPGPSGCTRCGAGGTGTWFSHRADPAAGRQLGVVVLREAAA